MTKKKSAGLTARDIMRTRLVEVPDTMPLAEVAALLSEHRISGAPVTDEAGQIIGVISMRDLLESYADEGRPPERRRHEFWASAAGDEADEPLAVSSIADDSEQTARDVMTAQVHTVPASADLAEVARRMVEHEIHRILVVDRGRHVGLISTFDVLRGIS